MISATSDGNASANSTDKMPAKRNYLYAVITVLIWATNAPLAKALLNGLPNLETLSISSFLAFGFLLAVNLKKTVPGC